VPFQREEIISWPLLSSHYELLLAAGWQLKEREDFELITCIATLQRAIGARAASRI